MKTWKPVDPMDEYVEPGDVAVLSTRNWEYFWNEKKGTVRRYGDHGEYQEAAVRKRPEPYGSTGRLSMVLNTLFSQRARFDTLLVDQR